jgi:hypothetical protein
MSRPDIFVLCRSKRSNRNWSAWIERQLNKIGLRAYRVTPNAVPRHRPERVRMVINYGVSTLPIWWDRLPDDCVIMNHPDQVAVSCDKVRMMQTFEDLCPDKCLEFCNLRGDAQHYIDEGKTVVSRTLTRSHSGRGIVLSPPDPLPDARLYTVLKRKRGLREYRVFLWEGELIDVVQKKRKTLAKLLEFCTPQVARTWWDKRERQVIRTWDNGWAFCHKGMDIPPDDHVFGEIARKASEIITWGCVDVLVNQYDTDEWYMVETNTAPGLDAGNTQYMFINAMIESYVASLEYVNE